MKFDNRWLDVKKSVAIVALASSAIVGVGGAAHASTPAPTVVIAAVSSTNATGSASAATLGTRQGFAASSTSPVSVAGDTRISVGSVVSAIKKIPGLWAKFSAAVKKAWSAFQTLWKGIKAALGVIGTLVSAWDIWKSFH